MKKAAKIRRNPTNTVVHLWRIFAVNTHDLGDFRQLYSGALHAGAERLPAFDGRLGYNLLRMLTLAIDTSTPSGSIAVLREERLVGILGIAAEETYSSRLFRHVRYLLKEMQLSLNEFDLYAVAAGPGSFTGLRIGLTAAKGWAEVFSKPVVGVSVVEAIAVRATAPTPVVMSLLDARRGQIFGAEFKRSNGDLVACGEEWVLTPQEVLEKLVALAARERVALASPTPEVIEPLLTRSSLHDVPLERISPLLAAEIGRIGYRRAKGGEAMDPIALDANYVRRSDAELKWRD